MIEDFVKSFKETFVAIIPICAIVTIIAMLFGYESSIIISFVISSILLVFGISLFTFGADISMMLIGEKLGEKLIKSKKIIFILFVILAIGIAITIAEPDLRVLAQQIPSIPTDTLILTVSVGVGIMLMIATLKILFKLDLRTILIISYALVFGLLFFVPSDFIPIAFDSSGVTTGPVSVPFILALGIGFTSLRTDSNVKSDTFGLIALCSVGPKIMVLILGMLYDTSSTFDTSIYENNLPLIMQYADGFLECFKNVFVSISPIILLFIIFKIVSKDAFNKKNTKKVIVGFIATFLGLCLFLTGVEVGFMKMGFLMGQDFVNLDYTKFLIPFVMVLGFLVVFAEPAVKILTNEVEEITEGSVTSKIMIITISIGVSLMVALSIIRVLTGISIIYFLIIGYVLAIILSFITPKMFTAIAFDTGGSVTGPLTATFMLPLVIGVCLAYGGNIMTDAFGLIAFVAMSPLITVQLLGIVFKIKTKQEIYKHTDETVIDYDWREAL